jgi:hypothetical protein
MTKFRQKQAKTAGIRWNSTNISSNTLHALAIYGSCAIITVGIKNRQIGTA